MSNHKTTTTAAAKTKPAEKATKAAPAEKGVVEFRGRSVRVKAPTAEQLVMFQRIARRVSATAGQDQDAQDLLKALDQGLSVCTALLVDEHDKTWLESEFFDGNLTMVEVYEDLLGKIVPALTNRAVRRSRARAA